MNIVLVLGAFAVCSSFIVLWWAVSGERGTGGRILRLGQDGINDMRALILQRSSADRTVKPLLERIGASLRKVTPTARVAALAKRIQGAGSPAGWTVERLIAMRVACAGILGLLFGARFAWDPSLLNAIFFVFATLFGYFLPIGLLDQRASARNLLIRGAVSDTVDQLAVMVRAGLGIDAAIARAATLRRRTSGRRVVACDAGHARRHRPWRRADEPVGTRRTFPSCGQSSRHSLKRSDSVCPSPRRCRCSRRASREAPPDGRRAGDEASRSRSSSRWLPASCPCSSSSCSARRRSASSASSSDG